MFRKIADAITARPSIVDHLSSGDLSTEVAILLALDRIGPLAMEDIRTVVDGSTGGTSRHLKTLRLEGDVEVSPDVEHYDSLGRPRARSIYRLTDQGHQRVAAISARLAALVEPNPVVSVALPVVLSSRRTAPDPPA